jgi:hypothetical protein
VWDVGHLAYPDKIHGTGFGPCGRVAVNRLCTMVKEGGAPATGRCRAAASQRPLKNAHVIGLDTVASVHMINTLRPLGPVGVSTLPGPKGHIGLWEPREPATAWGVTSTT